MFATQSQAEGRTPGELGSDHSRPGAATPPVAHAATVAEDWCSCLSRLLRCQRTAAGFPSPHSIRRITTTGTVTNYTGSGINQPTGIAAGPDGALWFTNEDAVISSIGRISTSGTVTSYTDSSISSPTEIAADPDGGLWFTNQGNSSIGRIQAVGAPSAMIISSASGATYVVGQVVPTSLSCSESADGPGIISCTDSHGGSGSSGTLDTSTTGPHTYTIVATSRDGLSATAGITYTVAAAPAMTITSPTATQGRYCRRAAAAVRTSH